MLVFLSYAHEDRPFAERIRAALNAAGFEVFVDTHSLPPGQEYNARIKMAIEEADLFLFLASAASLQPGSYALTELAFAEAKWRNPSGHVLPVLLEGADPAALPAYLRPIHALRIRGNAEAEIVGWVQDRVSHGSTGVPGLQTPRDRLRRWARLAQPPLRKSRRVFPVGSVFAILVGLGFLAGGMIGLSMQRRIASAGAFAETPFGEIADLVLPALLIFLPLLVGAALVLGSLWSIVQGLRGGGTPIPVVVLDRRVDQGGSMAIEVETLEGKRLRLSPVTREARELYAGDLGWAYVRGRMLLDFVPAAGRSAP